MRSGDTSAEGRAWERLKVKDMLIDYEGICIYMGTRGCRVTRTHARCANSENENSYR